MSGPVAVVRHAVGSNDQPLGAWVWTWCPGCDELHPWAIQSAGVLNGGITWEWDHNLEAPTFSPSMLVNAGQAHPGAPGMPLLPARRPLGVPQRLHPPSRRPDRGHGCAARSVDWRPAQRDQHQGDPMNILARIYREPAALIAFAAAVLAVLSGLGVLTELGVTIALGVVAGAVGLLRYVVTPSNEVEVQRKPGLPATAGPASDLKTGTPVLADVVAIAPPPE